MIRKYDDEISIDEEYVPNKKTNSSKQRRRKLRPFN
jgi:hypothetical protein